MKAGEGKNKAEIARDVRQSIDMVRLWRRWLELSALELEDLSVEERWDDLPRPGAPARLTADQVCQMEQLACEAPQRTGRPIRPWTGRELADEIVARGDTTYPTVSIYDATTGEWGTSFSREAPQYVGDSELVTNPLSGTALTPDGTQVLTTLAGTELMLVDVETGSVIHRFEEHDILVTALAISPEGTKAVSGDPSGRLMLWDLASGELLHQLEPVEGSVYTLEFGSNSERLYGSALDTQSVFMSGQRHVQWQYHSLTELINWACTNRIIVPLRDEERRRFRIGDATDPCIG